MALTIVDGVPVGVKPAPGGARTKNTLTVTLDGSATVGTIAGIAHGGPNGRAVRRISLGDQGPSSSDGVVVTSVGITANDTANNEVDCTVTLSAAGTNTETVTCEVFMDFDEVAADAGRTGGINYTVPDNSNVAP